MLRLQNHIVPGGPGLIRKARAVMDVILHLGAHRTASTTFQTYMRGQGDALNGAGIGYWGPYRTRTGLLHGVLDRSATLAQSQRARGRILLNLNGAVRKGVQSLVISDENMIGAPRRVLARSRLYPEAGERMARVQHGFDGAVSQILLQIRSFENYWASMLAFAVPRGAAVPDTGALDRLVTQTRSWRHVIQDIACAMPTADIIVTPFERFAGRPDRQLALASSVQPPQLSAGSIWENRSPRLAELRAVLRERGEDAAQLPDGQGRWNPFDSAQRDALRETYADDLYWLHAGADGLATYHEDPDPNARGHQTPFGPFERGHTDDRQKRDVAHAR